MSRNVTCNNCGWVHFPVSRKYAELEIDKFNLFWSELSKQEREQYYGNNKLSMKDYDSCNCCGGSYKNFRDSVEGDCPDGCTIGPIIDYNE